MKANHLELKAAVEALTSGLLVGIPTETVYGLAANALSPSAVARIFEAKKRPHFDPLIVHIGRPEDVLTVAREIPNSARKFIESFWPGPLTIVLPKRPEIPDIVTAGLDTVAVRMPKHPIALQLLRALDFPLAAPSANPFGYVSPTTRQHVLDQLAMEVAHVLDGGPCQVGLESTIIAFPNEIPTVLRLGGVTLEALEDVHGQPLKTQLSSSHPSAPGQLDSHYAPLRTIHLIDYGAECPESNADFMRFYDDKKPDWSLSLDGTVTSAAMRLFDILRRLDGGPDSAAVWIEKAPEIGLGRAVNDRLIRAAHHA